MSVDLSFGVYVGSDVLYETSTSVVVGKYEYPVETASYGLETVTSSVLVTRTVVS